MLIDEETAWLAGLLEGEGCFSLQTGGSPRISLSMTDEDIVTRAAQIITRLTNKKIHITICSPPNKKEWYAFYFGGKVEVRIVANAIIRFMGKRRRAQIVAMIQGRRLIKKIDLKALGLVE